MLVSENNANLYTKVSNSKTLSSKEFLAYAYGSAHKEHYIPLQEEMDQKKINSKVKLIALITASALVAGSIALALSKRKIVDLKYLEELGKETGEKIENLHLKDKIISAMSNFTNIKDDLWDKFTNNTLANIKIFGKYPFSFIAKISSKATDFYHELAPKSYISEWNSKKMKVIEIANQHAIKVDIPEFSDLYNQTADSIYKVLHTNGERITDNLTAQKVVSGNIGDTKIIEVAREAFQKISIEGEIPPQLEEALADLNDYKIKSFEKLIPKIRDICAGSAPTDLLTQLISIASLGVVVAKSDTKEEKESVIINLGIPLITALSTTTIALLKSISGATALAGGLILGELASYGAKGITYLTKKHNQKVYERIKAQVLEEQKNAH